ncbi:MAG TPA: Na/Pi cotransporter family protein [Candidatus Cloacimonadota bacterium]|mgnify:CR=1 FL=1|nr:Na/Pi cotransporter family protein [Candidatus Cloacimonadota bacterium]HPS38782.1 Na/Pi cotransporter family protein [Candidatus Cloacimonadota bacterium]
MSIIEIINLFGGLALFLFGMAKMSDNLQAVAGNEMRKILKKITDTPFKGVLVGMGVTGIIQSSSATTVMLIGLVNAGVMSLNQAIGVVMGANIGTTVTAQLIAFNIGKFAYGIIIVGVTFLFIKKSRAMEKWSSIILGFGLLFVGLNVMSASVEPLKNSVTAHNLMVNLSTNPILGVMTGALFTMIIQSSSASVGIVMVLAGNGLIPYEGAIYLIFGDNIGTTITAWLAGFGANNTAKRVAVVHTMFNVIGTIIFGTLTYLGIYPVIVDWVTPGDVSQGQAIARHLANAHTLFNVFNTILFLPFTGFLAVMAKKIIPKDSIDSISLGEPKHLNYHLISDPELAVDQSIKEMREMLKLVKMSMAVSYEAYKERNYKKQTRVAKIENAIDSLQKEITLYLVAVNERTNSDIVIQRIPALLHTVNDIEKMGDFTEEINKILNTQIISQKVPMSEEFEKIIHDLNDKLIYMLDLSITYLDNFDSECTFKIIELEGRINEQHYNGRQSVLKSIQEGNCDPTSGLNTIDFIDAVEEMADKMKNLVKAGGYNFVYDPVDEHGSKPHDLTGDDED